MKSLRCVFPHWPLCVSLIRFYEFRKTGKDNNTETITISNKFPEFCRFPTAREIGQVLRASPRDSGMARRRSQLAAASLPPLTIPRYNGQNAGRVTRWNLSFWTTNATDARYNMTIPRLPRRVGAVGLARAGCRPHSAGDLCGGSIAGDEGTRGRSSTRAFPSCT